MIRTDPCMICDTMVAKSTIKTYDRMAERYASAQTYPNFWLEEVETFEKYLAGRRILDAGCGPGRDTRLFIAKGYDTTSIDLSAGLLKEAMRRTPNGNFLKMDIAKLKFKDGSFDGIWCCATLIHVKKWNAYHVLHGFHRVLADGGALFVSVKEGSGESIKRTPDGRRFFANYTMEELRVSIENSGFEVKAMTRPQKPDKEPYICVFALRR